MSGKVVVTMGVIASGKSTLSEELAKALDAKYFPEPDERNGDNPYLGDFYTEMDRFNKGEAKENRYAGMMQLHLLGKRLLQFGEAQQIALRGGYAVIDAGFYQDTCFARILARSGQMPKREFDTYAMLYRAMTMSVAIPAVVVRIFMSSKTAQQRMVKRYEEREGRACEKVIPIEYLEELDDEIGMLTKVLKTKGSEEMLMAWEDDRGTAKSRSDAVAGIAERIKRLKVADPFLDYHARLV